MTTTQAPCLRPRLMIVLILAVLRQLPPATAITPSAPLSRERFLAAFAGKCIWFAGDSVSREMHFRLLSWANHCGKISGGATAAEQQKRRMCKVFAKQIKNRAHRTTRIQVDADPSHDVRVMFYWANKLETHCTETPLLKALATGSCDVFVLNSGFWHLINNGIMQHLPGATDRFISQLTRDPAIRAQALRRVFWRSMTRVEFFRGTFNNLNIQRMNAMMEKKMRAAGITVVNLEHHFEGARNKGKYTNDGLHPHNRVQIGMLQELLAAVLDTMGGTIRGLDPSRSTTPRGSATRRPRRRWGNKTIASPGGSGSGTSRTRAPAPASFSSSPSVSKNTTSPLPL